jgi:hypothetical protein
MISENTTTKNTTGYKYRWLKARFEKRKQELQLFREDLMAFLIKHNIGEEFRAFIKGRRKERRKKKQEENINNENSNLLPGIN